jgi:hypothetical protein
LLNDLNIINDKITKEKSLLESIYKREIIAALVGGLIVFLLVVIYYMWNGLFKYNLKYK